LTLVLTPNSQLLSIDIRLLLPKICRYKLLGPKLLLAEKKDLLLQPKIFNNEINYDQRI